MRDANHPIWRILQTAVYMAATAGFLWRNASSFDGTEILTLCELAVVIVSMETVKSKMKGAAQ